MDEIIATSLSKLVKALQEDERVVSLSIKEKAMLEEAKVKALINNKDKAEQTYNQYLLSHGENDPITKRAKVALHKAKLELDTHPLVNEYNLAYLEVRDLYSKLDKIIFGPYRLKESCKRKTC